MIKLLLWPLRIAIYGACAYLALFVILPGNDGFLGWVLSVPLAAVAIAADFGLSALLTRRPIEQVVASRVMAIDHVLQDSQAAEQHQLENVYEVEALEEQSGAADRQQLGQGPRP